jgi:hypothetical protein
MSHVWFVIALAVPMIDALLTKMASPDLAYQIRSGEIMLRTHSLLDTDVFTYTMTGKPWLNQQWAAQLFLGATYRLGGWNATVLMHAALKSLAFAFLFLACRRRGVSTRTAALLSIAGFWVARQNLAMRPQLIAVLLFAVTLWILAGRRTHPRMLWAIPALMVVWVNVHGSFVLVPVLLGLAWLEDRKESPGTARLLIAVCAASLAATLVNPFGFRVWVYAAAIGTNSTISLRVTEWAPPTIREYSGVVFFGSALIIVGYLIRRKEPVGWPSLIWLATFFLLALPALRGVVWWGLVFPVVLAGLVKPSSDGEQDHGSAFMNALLVTTIVAATIVVLPVWRAPTADGSPAFVDQSPSSLVEATEDVVPAGSRLFVSQIYASWFELALPTMPVFVDSRIEFYPLSLWDTYFDVSGAREGWQATLDQWDVDAVVITPDQDGELVTRIKDDPAWRQVFHDDNGYVFVRA